MVKLKTIYHCQACGSQHHQWQGQCRACLAWNTLVEEITETKKNTPHIGYAGQRAQREWLCDIDVNKVQRVSSGLQEFDLVLGGGFVPEQVVLIGGDPGVGKSTLLLQIMAYQAKNHPVLYVSGEESNNQIALRAARLGVEKAKIHILTETSSQLIAQQAADVKPGLLVIDSIQTMTSCDVAAAAGSVSQLREVTAQLLRQAKQQGFVLILIGHVTKEGTLAGPRVLEHMVDTVLYFEGKQDSRYRAIRAVKNRYGAVNALALLAMTEHGLKQVAHPSAIFLSRPNQAAPGSVVMVTWEGTRPLLVEIQALVDDSALPQPRRLCVGFDQARLAMLLAVLHRHAGVEIPRMDVFVNVVGGVKVSETAADLAVMLALISSHKNIVIPENTIAFGEVGLSGEIRPVPHGNERLEEAIKHGFTRAIIPPGNKALNPDKLHIEQARSVSDLIPYIIDSGT